MVVFSIENRLDKLKTNLKRGILGMDKVLQNMHQPCGDGLESNHNIPIPVNV